MAPSPVTAPSPDSPSSPTAPPPPPSSSSPPPLSSSSPPPPSTSPSPKSPPSSPPPPDSPSPKASPPPPSGNSSSSSSPPPPPPPPKNDNSPPPPPKNKSSPPSSDYSPPPPPPPPPHSSSRALSPPPPPHSSSSSSSSSNKLPIIVGASVGVGLLLVMFTVCAVCTTRKKKRKPDSRFYGAEGGGGYYNSGQHPNWHNSPQPMEHGVKLPPPPGAMGPPGGGWPAPPPPPAMMSSGEISSNFSGPRHPPLPPPSPNIALGFNKSTFSYDELAAATAGFSQANLLGQGGFGYVHKGVLPNGKEIAVKSLKTGSGQGEREFRAEVEIISRVHHRHLVSLVGYCIAGGQRMLVYEFVANNTLEYHLHGKGRPTMDWPTRLRIALGSAKGLAYLHEDCHPRIIHRDIKAANILIDNNFEAMVADFGLAKLSSDNYTHVSTRVMGTFGYLAPEYAASGKLTEKSDVFSYGVMLLELITGHRPVDNTMAMEDSLVDWARPRLTNGLADGNYSELVDQRMENKYDPQEMARMVACASATIRHSAKRRPKMSQIVRALEGDVSLDDLNEFARPGQSSVYGGSNGSSDYDSSTHNADMTRFRKVALSSQEFESGEYRPNPSSSSSGEMNHSGNQKHNFRAA